jgi:hypothetical protein
MASKIRDFRNAREISYNADGTVRPEGLVVAIQAGGGTQIPTAAGNTDLLVVVPFAGVLTGAYFVGEDALAANDTNYVTFSITNKGAAGAGSAAMLAASDANTTKATGGTAIAAADSRSLTLTSTAADLVVAAGDTLLVRAAGTGTLANVVDRTGYTLLIRRTA